MFEGSISLGARHWFWPALLLFLVGTILVLWSYARNRPPGAIPILGAFCKILGLALLSLCLLDPLRTTSRPREGANYFAVVADNSQGLEVKDRQASQTRGAQMKSALLAAQEGWQEKLGRTFQVRRYTFDHRLQSSDDFGDLTIDGTSSQLGGALRMLGERFRGQPLAGVLLFTDGNATDPQILKNVEPGVPVYPVLLGEEDGLEDAGILSASVSQTAFEDSPVTVQVEGGVQGLSGLGIKAELIQQPNGTNASKVVAEEVATAIDGKLSYRFQFKPEQPGLTFYTVKLSANRPAAEQQEATYYNNERVVVVDRGRGPYRILYVGGRPNWEYKFLNRAISEDPQIKLPALMRIARREPKFTFRGRAGESSNPLFRGFDKTNEETERYDQPVLVRLNTEEDELRGGFPKTAETLFGYHAIILDDLEAAFFTQEQLLMLQRFVSYRGGGFLMLGGADSLEDGTYARNAVGEMLPIYLDRAVASETPELVKWELSREGWLQPWARLRTTEPEELERLSEAPGFEVINTLREVKPGASVLATAKDSKGNHFPALVVQRFGAGRSAVITIGDLWRGGRPNEKMQEDLEKKWRQIARWLTADVPGPVELAAQPSERGGQAVELRVRARDKKFDPMDNATITLQVQTPGAAAPIKIETDPSNSEPGVFTADFVPRLPGAYRATASVFGLDGTRMGTAEAGWASDPLADEFKSLIPNKALMEDLARRTGGQLLRLPDLAGFVDNLRTKKAPVMETYSYPLWNNTAVLLAGLLFLCLEWGLRRWKGMA